ATPPARTGGGGAHGGRAPALRADEPRGRPGGARAAVHARGVVAGRKSKGPTTGRGQGPHDDSAKRHATTSGNHRVDTAAPAREGNTAMCVPRSAPETRGIPGVVLGRLQTPILAAVTR